MNMTENILNTYRAAPPKFHASGMDWYANVHAIAVDLGDAKMGAGVIAALSPNNKWDRNLTLAKLAMGERVIFGGTFGNSVRNANLIMAGEDPEMILGSKKGFKTLNFFRNIFEPFKNGPVTVDRHAYDIAVNKRHGSDYRPIGTSLKAYESYAQAYRDVAQEVGVLPQQVQAVTWEWYRSTLTSKRGK